MPPAKEIEMVSPSTCRVIDQAKEIYSLRLQAQLEEQHRGEYVAIEPESGDYFLAATLDDAVRQARGRHPSRLSHTIRIGYSAALELGVLQR